MTKTVLITGAGTGIGEACVQRMAALGHRLVLVGRRREALERVAAGHDAMVLAGDAADSAVWAGFIEQVRTRFGGLDALICCAGGHGLGNALETSDDAWDAAMRGNLHSAFHSARACLPLLIERRGSIVLLGSIASLAAGHRLAGGGARGVRLHHGQTCAGRSESLAGPGLRAARGAGQLRVSGLGAHTDGR